jgi:hypothetical protein
MLYEGGDTLTVDADCVVSADGRVNPGNIFCFSRLAFYCFRLPANPTQNLRKGPPSTFLRSRVGWMRMGQGFDIVLLRLYWYRVEVSCFNFSLESSLPRRRIVSWTIPSFSKRF